jgi:Na+-translocating ferredoxin:NAD+ oxidoreductase RnfG subunit
MKNTINLRTHYPCLFVAIIFIVSCSFLITVNKITRERIQLQNDATYMELLGVIFEDIYGYILQEDLFTIYDENRTKLGYAFFTIGDGFYGDIRMVFGLENDLETIKGVNVYLHNDVLNTGVEHGEPLDFSNLIEQLIGLRITDCILEKDGGVVDGITGATVSSLAVVNAIRETVLEKMQ